jgi:DNA-binding PadR family transcriptional regulator
LEKEFFAGFIKIHILYHAVQEEICGTDIAAELARHGYSVSPGTLYPTLHRLEKMGYLKRTERVSEGRRRKYYRATPAGRRALETARKRIAELVSEVMEGDGEQGR